MNGCKRINGVVYHSDEEFSDQMTIVGIVKINDEFFMRCIHILLQNFDGLVTTLNIQVRDYTLSFNEFWHILLEEEIWLKSQENSDIVFVANIKDKTST